MRLSSSTLEFLNTNILSLYPPQKIFYVSMGDTKGSIGLTWINTQISFNVAALLPGYSIGDTNF